MAAAPQPGRAFMGWLEDSASMKFKATALRLVTESNLNSESESLPVGRSRRFEGNMIQPEVGT